MKKKVIWKAAAAGAALAAIVLAGFAVAGVKQRRGVSTPAEQAPAAPAIRPQQGRILFQSRVGKGPWQIFSLDLSTGARTRLTRSSSDDLYPSASADGTWIAFESARDGSVSIWRMRSDGTGLERLTDARFVCHAPCWGNDISSVLYSSPRFGREQIFALELNMRRERQLTDSFWPSILPALSPYGSVIAFARNKLGWDVYRMNPDGSGARALTSKGGNCRPDWSPDGKRIAYVSDVADGKGDVWTMDADGGNKMRVTMGDDSYDYNPDWSADGRWIVYETTKGSKRNPWSLAVIPAGGGTPVLLSPPGADDRYPDWAPGKISR